MSQEESRAFKAWLLALAAAVAEAAREGGVLGIPGAGERGGAGHAGRPHPCPPLRQLASDRMEIKELGHVVLYVHDIERSTGFYRDVLGFRQILGRSGARFAGFSSGRTHHELLLIEVGDDALEIPFRQAGRACTTSA